MQLSRNRKLNASFYYVDRNVEEGRAERVALRTATESWTYRELLSRVGRAALSLNDLGVRRSDRVLLLHPDAPEAIAFAFAAMRIGAAPVPTSTQLTNEEIAFIATDCEATVMVATSALAERLALLFARQRLKMSVILTDELRETLTAADGCEEQPTAAVGRDDVALLQYTSGSTGAPKGVVHCHRGLLALPRGFGKLLALSDDDVCYSTAKLSFGYGFGNSALFPLAAGASTYLQAAPSDPVSVIDAVASGKPTVMFSGPTMYSAILARDERERVTELCKIRLFVSAGDTLSSRVFLEWERRFGSRIVDGLGSTECLHIFLAATPSKATAGRIGTAVAPYAVRLVDDDGKRLPPGRTGLLQVAGPAVFDKYWKQPEQTAETLGDGWVRTGDVLHQGVDGIYSYVGRQDDLFKVREMKVAPIEVEQSLLGHPAVAECAVVGRADTRGLVAVHAFIRLADGWRAGPGLERALRERARGMLSPHKVPKRFVFVEALPRTSTGKVTRHALRIES